MRFEIAINYSEKLIQVHDDFIHPDVDLQRYLYKMTL